MKTPVRILHSNAQGMYYIMHIEILSPRYGGNDHLELIGTIKFQRNVGDENWYGMSFDVSTDSAEKLKKFTKIATFIAKNSDYKTQPEEILKLIGADEHRVIDHEFVSKSKIGQRRYKVMVNGSQHYKNIIARDDKDAYKQLKRLEIANSEIVYTGVVVL